MLSSFTRRGLAVARRRKPTEWELAMGHRIFELRKRAKLSQEALARAAGVGLGAVRFWEKGKRTPGLTLAARLADALGCSLDELAGRQAPRKKGGGK
jgi:transcriptional regulator with XRE-family HTH domain